MSDEADGDRKQAAEEDATSKGSGEEVLIDLANKSKALKAVVPKFVGRPSTRVSSAFGTADYNCFRSFLTVLLQSSQVPKVVSKRMTRVRRRRASKSEKKLL